MISPADQAHMAQALRLAKRGLYSTSPNPRVGCVIVRDGVLVGEGWHQRAGEAHAEAGVLAEAGEATAAFREGLNVNGVPVLGADFAGLMRLYALALSAERDYALARGKAEALYRAREAAWAALQAHMAADVERVAAG